MSKVLTFSRTFPAYHPKAGQPTHFVEKVLCSLKGQDWYNGDIPHLELNNGVNWAKNHTIRGGNRFKAGDKAHLKVWGTDITPKSGRSGPYHSKQIMIAPDIEIKKVWDIEFNCRGGLSFQEVVINGEIFAQLHNGYDRDRNRRGLTRLAKNDGLELEDAVAWFYEGLTPNNYDSNYKLIEGKKFIGQIICWNDSINY